MGLRVRSPRWAKHILTDLAHPEITKHGHAWYRQFVYVAGAVRAPEKSRISKKVADEVVSRCGRMGLSERLRYRCLNFSEGVAIGTDKFISSIQQRMNRKHVRPRALGPPDGDLFVTRVLRAARN